MSSSGIILYGVDLSPCVRTVKLTLKALNLDYEYKEVNLQTGEHLQEDFLKKNPQHTVPVLDDNGTILWDSHAIATYLVDKYAKSDELYPKDLVKRAIINQRLFFDASVIFASLANVSGPFWVNGITVVPQEKLDNLHKGLKLLETFLDSTPYLAGDSLTLADLSAGPTVTALGAHSGHNAKVGDGQLGTGQIGIIRQKLLNQCVGITQISQPILGHLGGILLEKSSLQLLENAVEEDTGLEVQPLIHNGPLQRILGIEFVRLGVLVHQISDDGMRVPNARLTILQHGHRVLRILAQHFRL